MNSQILKTIRCWADLPSYQRKDAVDAIRVLARTHGAFVGLVADAAYRDRQQDKAAAIDAAAELLEAIVLDVTTLAEAADGERDAPAFRLPLVVFADERTT